MFGNQNLTINKNKFVNKKRTRSLRSNNILKIKNNEKICGKNSRKKETKLQKSNRRDNSNFNMNFCETIHATEEDFKNPVMFFENLWDTRKESTGIIKIIPPQRWKETNSYIFENFYLSNFLKNEKKLETREQILNELMNGKKFDFNKKFNFREYKHKAEELLRQFYSNPDEITIEKKEQDFWNFCSKNNKENQVKVHYAADISHETFLNKNDINNITQVLNKNNTWNLASIHQLKDSFFQFLKNKSSDHISGLTVPWVYIGMIFSTFCWHVEDLYMYSINYMYHGNSKIWYSVPHNQKDKLDIYIKKKISKLGLKDQNALQKLILLVDPIELIKNGIKIYKAIQNPGEIIFTLPKAYHCGFSAGFNFSEAVNLATYKWMRYGIEACKDYQETLSKTPVISIEWLLDNIVKHITDYEYSNKKNIDDVLTLFKKFLEKEKIKRENIENYLKKCNISYELYTIKDNESYTKLECAVCTNYGYFSFKKCSICGIKTCFDHMKSCNCKVPILMVYYRKIDLTVDKINLLIADNRK